MKPFQLLSRRNSPRRVDFRPDTVDGSPSEQLRRLKGYLESDTAPPDDITDCPDAIDAFREYTYRKIFTGTTHEQFTETDKHNPEVIDWLVAVAGADAEAYKRTQTRERN